MTSNKSAQYNEPKATVTPDLKKINFEFERNQTEGKSYKMLIVPALELSLSLRKVSIPVQKPFYLMILKQNFSFNYRK